jgi:hypothetical protein
MTKADRFMNIDWRECKQQMTKIQMEIAQAWRKGDKKRVTELQTQMVQSFAARALVIKRVMTNPGGKTPGVDDVVWDRKMAMEAIERLKNLKD